MEAGSWKREARIRTATESWDHDAIDVDALIRIISETYGDRGYARLAAWMVLAGWRSQGAGMCRPLAEAIHEVRLRGAEQAGRPAPPLEDSLFTVALLSLVLFAEPLAGGSMRRVVALPADRRTQDAFIAWLADLVRRHLETGEP